jgi:5S rRNA maturation endonuclease (ribonuclease M5)
LAVTIFLSHSTHDDATVAALRTALQSHGVSVWADSQRLSAGEELTPRIQEAIANAQHVLVKILRSLFGRLTDMLCYTA